MVAIVGGGNGGNVGNSALGLENSSLTLGGAGVRGHAATGQSGESVFVNAATGNLVIQRQDELLTDIGIDAALLRTYNSLGKRTDDNADNWQMSVVRIVGSLTGTLNAAGSSITRTDGDGSSRVFAFDAQRNLYLNRDGQDAFDTLSYAAGTWTFTDGASARTETFDWNGSSGRITASADADGNTSRYGYTGSLLTLITDASGERIRLNYSGTLLTDVRTERADGSALTRVRYSYDASNRLSTVTIDLSPDDQSVTDAKTYVTRYTYVGTSTVLQSVTQSDGTAITFNSYDSSGRLTSFTQAVNGINRVTTLAYGTGETRVTDALGAVTTYKTDAAGRLSGVVTPAQTLTYEYDSNGRLSAQVDGNGRRTVYGYDGNGNQVLQRDAAGNTVMRSFGSRNELLTETRYATPDTDGAGAALPGVPQTTRYAYDSSNRLRFAVTAEGRVTEYRYSAQGLRTSQFTYAGNRYPMGTLTATAALAESTVAAWTAGADKTKLSRIDHAYDARGNLSKSTSFSKTLVSGEGVLDGTESVSQFTYDQAGLLLSTVSATGSATTANATDGITRYGYDGLGRLVTSTDALGNTTLQQYDLQGNALTTRQANGLFTTSVHNTAGELVSVLQADGATSLGRTAYTYDAAGQLRVRVDATGVKIFWLYDAAGRKSAEIDGNGSVTEWLYNGTDQVVRTIRYASALTPAQLTSLTDAAGNPSNVTLTSLRPATAGSRSTWSLYDEANRLAKTVDELGYVTQYQYDGASRLMATVQYSKPVNAAMITATTRVTDATVSPLADALNARKTSVIFDNDGRQVGSVDADGTLTQTDYDAAGRAVHIVRYAQADMAYHGMSAAAMTSRIATEASNSANVHAWTFYDGQGRESASVNGEGFTKEIRYDLAGNRRTEVQYLQVQAGLVDKLIAGQMTTLPVFTGPSLTTINDYDTLNRLIRSTNAEGTVTQYQHDSAGNLTRTDRAWNTTDLRTTATRYDKLGRITAQLSGEGSAALAVLPATATTAQIDAVWGKYATTFTYDAASRQTGSTDPLGNRTLRYYDADGQLSHVINAAGEVTAYAYDALGQMTHSVRYAAAIGSNVLASLSGGLVNATVTTAVAGVASANDAKVTTTYTLRGQVDSVVDEQGYLSRSTYNAFGEQDSSTRQIDATRQVKSTLAYNRRGQVSSTVEDAGVTNRATSTEYDAFGRMVKRTEPGSRVQQWTYDRTGRVIQTMDPYRASDSFTYDALGRELTHTDALGNTSRTVYDDANRRMTVTSAEGVAVTSTRNRHGELIQVRDAQNRTTSYQYNRDGQLTKTSHDNVLVANNSATGITELASYDTAGRLIESTDGNGVVTRLAYDAANRVLTRITDPNGLKRTTSTSYDSRNRAVTVTDANGVVTRTTYNKKGETVTVAVDPTGQNLQTSYAYDGLGNTVTVTEGVGSIKPKITTYTYDNLGRRTSEATAGTGGKTHYTYDAANRLETKTDALGNVTRLFYDPAKSVTYVIDPEGGVTRTTLDAEGRTAETRRYANKVAGTVRPDFSKAAPIPESADDQITTNLYDRDGRLIFVVDGTRGVTERKYDGNGNVTGTVAYANRLAANVALTSEAIRTATRVAGFADAARDERTHATYDALNRLTLQINGAGGITTWAYDGNGNVIEQRAYANAAAIDINRLGDSAYVPAMPVADASRDRQQVMAYDTAGRLIASATALKASGSLVEWAVTLHDYKTPGVVMHTQLATALVSPRPTPAQLLGAARNTSRDLTTLEFKDTAGRIAYTINANRIVTGYSYDKLGRVVSTRTCSQPLTATVNLGGLTSASLPTHLVPTAADRSSRTVYDAASRPVYAIDSQGAVTETLYDALNNPVVTTSYATPVNFAALNDASQTKDVLALLKPVANVDRIERRYFDGNGHAVYRIDAKGYVTQSDYDALGRVVGTTEHASAVTAPWTAVTFTTRAQVASALNAQTAAQKAASRSNSFRYDQAGRLKESTDGTGRQETFTYDGIGRKTGFTDKNGAYWDYVHDAAGRLVKETSPQVDVLRFKTDANGAILLDAAGLPVVDHSGMRHLITLTAYDNFGNVTSRTEAAGLPEQRTTSYAYSADGRQISTIHPTVAAYADEGSAVLANGAAGNAVRKESAVTPISTVIYDALGNAVVNRDIGGKYRYRVIDSAGQLRYEVDAMGYVTGYERNSFGEVIALTRYAQPITTSAQGATPYKTSDIELLLKANLHDADRTIRTAYDNLGRIIKVTEPQAAGFDATTALVNRHFTAARTTDRQYNAFGDLLKQSVYGADAAGNPVTVAADTGYAYNALGQQVAIVTMAERAPGATSAKGYLTVMHYDSRGNLSERIEYASAYDYPDAKWGSITGVAYSIPATTNADRRTVFEYDANNRKVAETKANVEFAIRPDGTTTRGNATTRYGYDGLGNATSVTDANGTVTYTYYDALGRVTATATPSVQRLRAQVAQVYAAILNRSPDKAGLDLFVNKILAGTTLEQVTEAINASDEAQAWRNSSGMAWFRQMASTDTSRAIVTMLYRQLLSREPDAAGIDGWVRLMNGQTDGVKRTTGQITAAMMRAVASEMSTDAVVVNDKTRAALAFADAGGNDVTAARNDAAAAASMARRQILVVQLHVAVLGRTPDTLALEGWVKSTQDAAALVQTFMRSEEGRALYPEKLGSTQVLGRLFRHVHDRDPSAAELASLSGGATQLTPVDYAAKVTEMLAKVNDPSVPASATQTIAARIELSRKVASALPGGIDVFSGAMPLTEYERDALGSITMSTDYAGASEVATAAGYWAPAANALDRLSYTVYDRQGNALQRIDTQRTLTSTSSPKSVSSTSYDVYGHVAKEWRTVTDLDGRQSTVFQVNRHDANGQLTDTVRPGATAAGATGPTTTVASKSVYNAFGEVIERKTDGVTTEYAEYDNAGHLWRSNAGDGVVTVAQFDIHGRQTAEMRSAVVDMKNEIASAHHAAFAPGVIRSETHYDLMGRVVAQVKPEQLVDDIDSNTGAPTVATVSLQVKVNGIATPDVQEQPNGGDTRKQVLFWTGKNNVTLQWSSLAGLGSGDIKVQFDYLSRAVAAGDYPQSLNVIPNTSFPPQAGTLTRTFSADDAATGVALEWGDASTPGFDRMTGLTVWKKDVDGNWTQVLKTAREGVLGSQVRFNAPPDLTTAYELFYRPHGATADIKVGGERLWHLGDQLVFDTTGLAEGDYSYTLRTLKEGSTTVATLNGGIAIASPERRAQVARLFAVLLNRAPDANGLQSHVKALEAGTTIAQLAQNLLNTAEARALYPATLTATQFVQNLLSIALGTPVAQSQAFATAAAARLGSNPASWGAGIIALLDDVAASRDPALASARALLANKTAVAAAFAGEYGGYRYNDAREVMRLVTATDTTAALSLAKQALLRRQLTQLYVGLLHRAPDGAGLQAWLDTLVKGTGIDAIARGLLDSAEGKLVYPPTLSNAEFVTRFYEKVFGRTPDAEGHAFWTAALNQNPDRSKVAQDMMRAVVDYLGDNSVIQSAKQLLNNRISIGLAFADSGSNDAKAATVINAAVTAATNVTTAAAQMAAAVSANSAAVQANASAVELAAMSTPAERTLAQLSALYVVLLNRAPDRAGLLGQAAGLPPQLPLATALANTAQAIYASQEAQAAGLYLNLSDTAFVGQVVKFAFNRVPTAAETARWTQALAGNANLRGGVALSIINESLTYDGPDPVLADSRNLLNARIATGMTYALNLGGEDATLARAMLAKVTATNTSDALKLASDTLSAAAAARAVIAAASTTAALPRTNADIAAADAQAKALLAIDVARALATTATTPETEHAHAIARIWFAVTGKALDLATFTKAFGQLRNGASLSTLTQDLLATTDGLARYAPTLDNAQFVSKVYSNVINRAPDADGLAYWKRALDGGASRGQILFDITYAFLNLSEASAADLKQRTVVLQQLQTTIANLGNAAKALPALYDYSASTVLASRATPAERSYTQVAQLYAALLGRAPERAGLLYQAATLQAGDPATWNSRLAQIASNILNSAEAQGNGYAGLNDGQFIARFYTTALGRSPTNAESGKWMAMLGGDAGRRGQAIVAMLDDMLFATPSDSTLLSAQNLFNNQVAAGLSFALDLGGSDVSLARAVHARVTATDTAVALAYAATAMVTALTASAAAVYPNADTALTRVTAELAPANTLAQASAAFDSAATLAASPAAASGVDTAVLITRLYRAVFNRAPDNEGFNWWFQNIKNGQTIESVAQAFLSSGEALTTYPPSSTNGDFINRIYGNLLGRAPDAEGLAFWTNNLNRGMTRGKVFLDVLNAYLGNTKATLPDLQRRSVFNQHVADALTTSVSLNAGTTQYSAYVTARTRANADVSAGVALLDTVRKLDAASIAANAATSATASSSGNLTAQITLVYLAALNRVPDIPGLLNNLQSGLGIASIAANVVGSSEAQSLYPASLSAIDFVTRIYQNMIGRAPDAGGLAYWTAEINGGKPRGAVLWSIISSALTNTTSTFTTKVATSDLQLRSKLLQRWVTGLTSLRNTAATGSDTNAALANLVGSNTAHTNSLISQANALAPTGATGTLPQRQTQVVRLYALLLNRAPTVDELNTATTLLQNGKTVADIAGSLLNGVALTIPQLIEHISQKALGNVPDAALRARWSSKFAGQSLAQAAAGLSAEIVGYQGIDLSALTVQNGFKGRTSQYLANLAVQASAIGSAAVAERTALLNGLTTAATRAQAETAAASAQVVARTATDTANATATTPVSLQATKLIQAYQAILGRAPDVIGFGNYLAQLQGKTNLPAEYNRIAQELLDSPEGRALYPSSLSNSQFITQVYTRIIGRAPDASGLDFWTKALATTPRGQVLLDLVNVFLTNPNATAVDLQSRSTFLGKTAITQRELTTSASAISTAASALTHLVANYTGATVAANRATDAAAKAAMTTAATLRTQLTGLYVMLMNRSPDYDGLSHWSKVITAGTHKPADVAQALLESDAGRAAYPAAMSNAEFVSKLYQQVLGRAPDAAGLAHWSSRIQVVGRGQTTVELAKAMVDYAQSDLGALSSQWLFNNKVTQSLAGLQATARNAVTAASQQTGIAAQLATVNLPTSTQPAGSAVKVNTTTTDNRRPQVTLQVDRWGNVVSMTDLRSGNWITRYTYNAGNDVTSITNAEGKSLFYTYDQLGRQVSSTDANGNVTGKRYDALGRAVQQLQADGGVAHSQYDAFGQRIRLRQANGVLTDYAYDHLGRVNRVSQAAVMGVDVYRSQTDSTGPVPRAVLQSHQALTETSRYDELGRRIQITGADGTTTRLYYDLRGNLSRQVDAGNRTTQYTYDKFDHITVQQRADGKTLRWDYHANGTVQSHADLSGRVVNYSYNRLNQVVRQWTPATSATSATPTSASRQDLVFSYDNSSGLLTKIVDHTSGQVTRYAYDLAGNRTREKTSIESNGRQTKVLQDNHISYDKLGRMTRVADSRYRATFEYDANGNRTHQTVAYIDDNNTAKNIDLWNAYDKMNRQTVVDGKKINGAVGIDANGGQQISYDNAGNRIAVRQWGRQLVSQASDNDSGTPGTAWSSVAGMVQETYRYDAAGRLSKTLRDGLETDTRKYDAAGRAIGTGASTLQVLAGSSPTLGDALAQTGVQADVYTNTYNIGGQLIHQGVKDIGGIDKSGMQMDKYDDAGNLLQYTLWQAEVGKQTSTYTYTYDHFDSSQVSSIKVVRGDKTASTVNTFDGRGQMTSVTSTDVDRKVTLRSLSNNAEGQVLEKVEEGRKTHSLMVNGELLGSSAAQADGKVTDTFAANYEPVNAASLSNAPTSYRVQKGQTLQSIAKVVWGDANLWYLIADANGVSSVKEGDLITIPTRLNTVHNDYQTYKPYDASSVIGDITPTLPMPAAEQGCGAMGQVLMVAVAIIVTAYTAGTMSGAAGSLFEVMQAGTAFMGGTATAATEAIATTLGSVASSAIAGATGSIASQFVGNVIGAQDGFSLKNIGLAAIGAGVANGMSGLPSATNAMVRAAAGNVAGQGIGLLTGLRDEFHWKDVVASVLGAGVGGAVADGMDHLLAKTSLDPLMQRMGSGMVSGMAAGVASSVYQNGKVTGTQGMVDAFSGAFNARLNTSSIAQTEPHRILWRHQHLREWCHEQKTDQVFPGSQGARSAPGARAA